MRKVNQLSVADAAYLAGIIDGEGTITLIRKHRNENRQLSISISSTERAILEYLIGVIGAGKITNKKASKQQHTPSFAYALYNRQALSLLEQIQPFLRSYKSRRADIILKNYIRLTPRNGKYSEALLQERAVFEQTVLSLAANEKCHSS